MSLIFETLPSGFENGFVAAMDDTASAGVDFFQQASDGLSSFSDLMGSF